MRVIFIALFICPICKISLAQTITFDKYYSGSAYSIVENEKNEFIITGTGDLSPYSGLNSKLRLLKLDKFGEKIWEKYYDALALKSPNIILDSDRNFIVIASKQVGEYVNLFLIKINSDGDTLWTCLYPSEKNELCSSISKTQDGGFIISGYDITDMTQTGNVKNEILIKIDSQGKIIWKKYYNYPYTLFTISLPVIEVNNGFMLLTQLLIIRVNSQGEITKTITPGSNIYSLETTLDGGIIYQSLNQINKIDSEGNNLWTKQLSGQANFINKTKDSCFILIGREFIKKINQRGDLLWEKSFPHSQPFFIKQTNDAGFIITGRGTFITKTDLDGNLNSLFFDKPAQGNYLTIGENYNIEWTSRNVPNVKLQLTSDDGISWITIADRISEINNFKWFVENIPGDNIKLKISDLENLFVFDISDSFTIGYNPSNDFIAINQIKMWIKNNGDGSHDPYTDGQGLYWPGGVNATMGASFEDGLLWGGKINGEIKVNGNTHRQGITSGKILSDGKAGEPIPIWKIKNNWQSLPSGAERDRYQYNYENWPGDLGAPFIDVDKDNKYTKGIDQPSFLGDEVLWYAANDLDTLNSLRTYGSNPIGLEIQVSTFGYDKQNDLADVVFKKYKIINKSGKQIEDMYLSYWADPDLGDANDDYTGCDTTLNLGYIYNGNNNDALYGAAPPAIGYQFIQGPVTEGNISDSARINDTWSKAKKNLPMTAFSFYIGANSVYQDPNQGQYSGTLMFYNNMQGLIWTGDKFIDPVTNLPNKYVLPGDPVSGIGWYEGKGWTGASYSPGDRRFLMSSGPFNMTPSDTQEIVLAIIMARGTDNINSVSELKRKARVIQEFYDLHMPTTMDDKKVLPNKFELYQNYPNPFNPSTTISYQLPVNSDVTLKLFDVLGKVVATLLNEKQNQGIHHYPLSIMNYKLSSGVYFYQLKAGEYLGTKKMMLLK